MAVNRMRAALAAPRKGETFELRSGLVYVRLNYDVETSADLSSDRNTHGRGKYNCNVLIQPVAKCVHRKESIQKTIMAMTLGKDVSALFPDVLKNIATADIDQKKLVYLYLMYEPLSRSMGRC